MLGATKAIHYDFQNVIILTRAPSLVRQSLGFYVYYGSAPEGYPIILPLFLQSLLHKLQ